MKKQSISKKIAIAFLSTALATSASYPLLKSEENTAEAASGWKYSNTQYSSSAASDISAKGLGYAAMASLGYITGGSGGSIVTGTLTGFGSENLGAIKTVYFTDKQYIKETTYGPQVKHNVTAYKDKKRTKKIGSGSFITSEQNKKQLRR